MSTVPEINPLRAPCRILSLDGGGAKGFYTLGVLAQVEAMLKGKLLCDHFLRDHSKPANGEGSGH